jgi:hypothetical protein
MMCGRFIFIRSAAAHRQGAHSRCSYALPQIEQSPFNRYAGSNEGDGLWDASCSDTSTLLGPRS